METVLLTAKNKSELKPLLELAKRLGMKTRSLSKTEIEDFELAQKIEKGLKSKSVSRDTVMKALMK